MQGQAFEWYVVKIAEGGGDKFVHAIKLQGNVLQCKVVGEELAIINNASVCMVDDCVPLPHPSTSIGAKNLQFSPDKVKNEDHGTV